MASISNRERLLQRKVIDKCWHYLNANFHNFTEQNKIRIIIALCSKDMPQEIQGSLTQKIVEVATIRKEVPSGEPGQEPTNRIAEYLIGSASFASHIEHTNETPTAD